MRGFPDAGFSPRMVRQHPERGRERMYSQPTTATPSDTRKELIARAMHGQSACNGAPFAKLNCGAIPTPLLESELFGHERGVFTGALGQTNGRSELANRGKWSPVTSSHRNFDRSRWRRFSQSVRGGRHCAGELRSICPRVDHETKRKEASACWLDQRKRGTNLTFIKGGTL